MSWRARLSTNIQQVRFNFCPDSAGSQGTRSFITKNYSELKRLNPRLPLLVRPHTSAKASIVASYDYGGQAERIVEDLSEKQVAEKLQELAFLGQHALKANHFPWQSSVPKDVDSLAYDDIKYRGF